MRHITFRLLPLVLAAGAAVTGCGTTPETNAALEDARTAYETAARDPQVVEHAPLELQRSREALTAAEQVWQEEADSEEVAHLAYLTRQRVAIARQTAQYEQAQEQIARAGEARNQALLESRTAELEAARQQLQEMEGQRTERGTVLTLGNVLFTVDGANLEPGALSTISQLAEFLQNHPDRTVLIEGFTDSTGSEAYNLELSQHRADAVREALLDFGVSGDRIRIRGYGEALPVATNDTAAGRQLNRRVEVVVSDPGEPIPARRA